MSKAEPPTILGKPLTILGTFLRDEAVGGRLIILAAAFAIIAVNTPLVGHYYSFWQTNLTLGVGNWTISQSLLLWLNEGLMSLFFFVVGLEVRREVVDGELQEFGSAALPVAAAIGGMLFPAVIYLLINQGQAGINGWGIPMATDIAIAVGVISLLGKRIPGSLRVFLLTLAIVDDIGAVLVIAIFYSRGLGVAPLLGAICLVAISLLLRKIHFGQMPLFAVTGVGLWLCLHQAGVNPSLAGVLLAFLVPIKRPAPGRDSIASRFEKLSLPLSTFVIVPLFAFANAGIVLTSSVFSNQAAALVGFGVFAGLVVGKVLGISLASVLMIKLKISPKPRNTNWTQLIGVGLVAGIGFTISIYIAELAFPTGNQLANAAKVGIFAGSLVSGSLGLFVLARAQRAGS